MGRKLLVVDDSGTMRKMVLFSTKKMMGFDEQYEAGDGLEAIDVLTQHPDIELIICDVNMPNMNGLDFLKTIKKDENFQHIPVIMLTTEGEEDDKKKARELGASEYVIKPFKPQNIQDAIKKVLG